MTASTPAAPVRGKRPRVFYGWWIVVGALVAQFVAIGTQAPVAGAFLVPMTEELGWGRAEFAIATSVGTFVSAIVGFFVGVYVDRYGARPLMVIGATIIGGTLMAISRVEELWQFVLLRGVIFTLGFVLVGNLVVNVTLSKWFVRRRGWAISMASLGVSLGAVVITPVMVRLVDEIGWRDAWMVMGVAAWALIYPTALIMRRQPEDHGMLPDGAQVDEEDDAELIEEARLDYVNSFTRGEAIRTSAMWLLVIAFGFGLVGLISMLFHAIPYMTDNGFSRSEASLIFSLQGVAALLSKFVWGWWMQRVFPRGLAAISFVISGGGVLLMLPAAEAGSIPLMATAFFIFGWGIGGMIPLQEFIWASFFGRRHLGAVRSAAMPASIVFAAGGPVFAGAWNDIVGNYNGALLTFVAMWGVGALLVMLARAPTRSGSLYAVPVETGRPPGGGQPPPSGPEPSATAEERALADEEREPAIVASAVTLPGEHDTDRVRERRIVRDYGLAATGIANGASKENSIGSSVEPPPSATPTLRLPATAGLVKPPLDPSALDAVLSPQRWGDAEFGWEPSTPAREERVPETAAAPAVTPADPGAASSSEFVAFEAPPRRPRMQRFVHEPVFDLSELEREPAAEPIFERTPEPTITIEAVTAEQVIDPWLTREPVEASPPEPTIESPPGPPPLRIDPVDRLDPVDEGSRPSSGQRRTPSVPGRRRGVPRPSPSSTRAVEVSLGSAARALQRSLSSEGPPVRDVLPAVAVGVATSAVTIGLVMLLRRGR